MNRVHERRDLAGATGGAEVTSRVITTLNGRPRSHVLLDAAGAQHPRVQEDPDQQDRHQTEAAPGAVEAETEAAAK